MHQKSLKSGRFGLLTVLLCGACSTQPITPNDFIPHQRFSANIERERAYAECRAQAMGAMNAVAAQPNVRVISGAVAMYQTGTQTMIYCMDAKGFAITRKI